MSSHLTFSTTADGSKTLYNAVVGEHYHSCHGALQESRHVFLQSGLKYFLDDYQLKEAAILEVGFGTGLNFLLAADFCVENHIKLRYTGLEAYPLSLEMISATGYDQYIPDDIWKAFLQNYSASMEKPEKLADDLCLEVIPGKLIHYSSEQQFDVIFFDAFASAFQPEMWTSETLEHVCSYLKQGGVFVTYAITGNLKRSMKALGFRIEKAPGAPGKREMLRAVKL